MVVDLVHLFRDHINSHHLVVLRQQSGDGKADVARTGHRHLYIF